MSRRNSTQKQSECGFMLLEYLSLLALFVILLSLTLSSWQILQTRKILKQRMINNVSLWQLHETALQVQEKIFMGSTLDPDVPCNIANVDNDLSLLNCLDTPENIKLSIIVSTK